MGESCPPPCRARVARRVSDVAMRTRTALLLLACALCYRAAQFTAGDLDAARAELSRFASDPARYARDVHAHLERTGALRLLVLAVCSKALSWHFARRRTSRAVREKRE